MRVLHLVDTLETGGAQRLLVVFARMAREKGVDTNVVSLREDNSPSADDLRALGVDVAAFPATWLLAPGRLWRLWRFVRRSRCDIIHAHLAYSIVLGAIVGRLAGLPVVASLHSTGREPTRRHENLRWTLEKWALRRGVNRVIAVGQAVADAHRDEVRPDTMIVLPNAVQPPPALTEEERCRIRADVALGPDCPLAISVGRLNREKGFDDLITAWTEVRRAVPDACVAIAGGGGLMGELLELTAKLDLGEHVRLLGERQDVPALLDASDLFVLASRREGLPLSLLEAMSAGLPVVATDVGDVKKVVGERTGWVVPPGEPAVLACAITAALLDRDHARELGVAGKARIAAEYDPDVWFDRLMGLYVAVLSGSA